MVVGYGKKRRAKLDGSFEVPTESNVTPLKEIELTKNFNGEVAHFNRLLYLGVPDIKVIQESPKINRANRDAWVRDTYAFFNVLPTSTKTGGTYFGELCRYIRWLDDSKIAIVENNYSSEVLLKGYNTYLNGLYKKEKISRQTANSRKAHLRGALKCLGASEAGKRCLIKIRNARNKPTQGKASAEFGKTLKELIRLYHIYSEHYLTDTKPEICPSYDGIDLTPHRAKYLKRSMNQLQIENQLNSLALLIFSSYTGANLSPCLELKRNEIEITPSEQGGYKLTSKKSRAQHQEQPLSIGCTKRAYEFFDGWIKLADVLNEGADGVFEFRDKDGRFATNTTLHSMPHKHFKKPLKERGFGKINTRMNRASRQNLVHRAYKDTQITASAGSQSIRTTRRHYSEGDPNTSELKITAGFRVLVDTATGRSKKESINEHVQIIEDVFSSEEWKKKKESRTSLDTPSGVKCKEPFSEKAKKSLRAFRELSSSDNAPCIDYLECLDCPYHQLVADVEHIWMMLSFKESIQESLSKPSINAFPTEKADKLLVGVDRALKAMKNKDIKAYREAVEKNNSEPHPAHAETFNPSDFTR